MSDIILTVLNLIYGAVKQGCIFRYMLIFPQTITVQLLEHMFLVSISICFYEGLL